MNEQAHESVFGGRLDIKAALTNPAPKLDFVLPGLVAGTAGLLVGPGGVGKTMLELQLAITIAAGLTCQEPLLGPDWHKEIPASPQRVVLIAAEESQALVALRLHAITASLVRRKVIPQDRKSMQRFLSSLDENLHIYALEGLKRVQLIDEYLLPTRATTQLEEAADGARLVIVDPLRQLHLGDENQSSCMSALMSVFKAAAGRTGAAFIVAHHMGKGATASEYAEFADASRGSSALKDDARWQLNIALPTKKILKDAGFTDVDVSGFVMLADAKGNYGAKRHPVLLRRGPQGVLEPPSNSLADQAAEGGT